MLTALNAVVTPGTPTPAANAVFDAVWTGEKIEGKAAVEAPSDLLAGRESKVTIDATTKHGKLTADGKLLLGDAPRFDGSASGATPSLRELCRWAGIQDCKDDEIGAVSVDGKLRADPQTIALASGTFKLESSTGEADVTYSKAGPRPSVTGKIKADKLDAKRHLGFDFSTAPTSAAATPAEPFSFRNAHESLKQSLAAFIAQAAEAPNAALAAARATASQPPPAAPPLDFAALKTMDIDLEMAIGALKVREFDVGVGKLMTTLKDGHLKLDGKDIALEGGRGSVRLELDTRPAAPALVLATDMKDIEARRLVTAITGQQAVTGKSTLIASIQGAGKSERELVTSLKGTVDARVNKGQIIGYDLARAISEFWATHDFDARARTPFEKVTAGFVLEKGIAKSSLIDFESPAVNFRASGLANLINRVLDYRLYLTLPSPPGFSIPVRAQGPWSKPNVSFDWEALFPRAVQPVAVATSAGPPSLGDPETDTLLAQAVSKSGQSGALAPEAIDMLKAISAPRR
jgi:AsmA protein